jgi:hypothetical protein
MRNLNTYLILLLLGTLVSTTTLQAQESAELDSTVHVAHSPKKAALLSALLPGAGQVYNHKYWKVPIVYGALSTATYFFISNRHYYRIYRDAYLNDLKEDEPGYVPSEFAEKNISKEQLRAEADRNRRNMELSVLGFGLLYGLQIIDATVDAHLFSFDVSDDLSLQWSPVLIPHRSQEIASGLSLNFSF